MRRLFDGAQLSEFLDGRKRDAIRDVDSLTGEYLLGTNPEDLCDYYIERFGLTTPELKLDEVVYDQREVDVDVSQDFNRGIYDRSAPFYIKGTAITFVVPFFGDSVLFRYSPHIFSSIAPHGDVEGNELHIEFKTTDQDGEQVQRQFDQSIKETQSVLETVRENVSRFNETFIQEVRHRLADRREKLLKDQGMAASIRYPMRKREGGRASYSVPVVRKKLPIQLPPASNQPFKPEPELEMKGYEEILCTISNMAVAIERSPKTFVGIKEEGLRTFLLVSLNGQYEGAATGETFNGNGKTDILIRVENRNIFIAECKFWSGPEGLIATIDQLLGYTSWRDTKAAILLFNRNKNLSAVLQKIPDTISGHPNFKRHRHYPSETGFRFVLAQQNDPSREIMTTLLVFDIPVE
jgi:hypothetical protein